MKKNIKQFNQHGFTLMELLVSISVFVIVTISALTIYSVVLKTSQKTIALTRIQQEAQFIFQVLSKKIRTSVVDYTYYLVECGADGSLCTNGEVTKLVLEDAVGDKYYFKQLNGGLAVAANPVQPDEDDEYKKIPSTNVTMDSLSFYINPTTNPFSLDAPPTSQPYVMITMEISSTKALQTASLNIQQIVPQRSGGY